MKQIVMASHIVKPSSPTPAASKIHKLSFIDQMCPRVYIPHIYLYQNDDHIMLEEICRNLKRSLSEILSIFYPLAGTIRGNSFVDCDDTGAEFVEARVHARLADFLENPAAADVEQLVPVDSWSHDDGLILRAKASMFECGGLAVGMCMSHKVADGASAVAFMNAWATACRGEASRVIHPYLDLASHFPPRELLPRPPYSEARKEEMVLKRLVFDGEKLQKLRNEAKEWCEEVQDPSRVEALSVFIWRSLNASKAGTPPFQATHAVDLRRRMVPPLPENTFGNCCTVAHASADAGLSEGVLLSRLRAAIRAVSTEDEFEMGKCDFSSWWRFPMYEVDWGWGRPVWVAAARMPYNNLIVLMSTPSGDGIEAWINTAEEQSFHIIQANYDSFLTT